MNLLQVTKIFGKQELNVIYAGLVFLVLFSGFFTLSNLENVLLDSIHKDSPEFTGDGFISLAILYIVFAVSIWIVPSLLTITSPKVTLVIGTLGYSAYTASFYAENAWVLYLGSICNGLGAALLWTGQGHYMVLNSTPKTIQKFSALFAVLSQSSMLFGNIVVYFVFQKKSHIDSSTRTLVLIILLGFSVSAFLMALLLPPPIQNDATEQEQILGPLESLKKSILLVKERKMMLMITTFIQMGLQITFVSGVYGPCIGFTLQLENSKELVPLNGFFAGVGELIICILLIATSTKLSEWKYGGCFIMFAAFVFQIITFCLIILNIPNSALLGDTMDISYFKPSAAIALLCSSLLGAGDAVYMVMTLTMVGKLYPKDSAQAVPIYIFFLSFASALSFFYSMFISLHLQVIILICSSTIGTIALSYISLKYYREFTN